MVAVSNQSLPVDLIGQLQYRQPVDDMGDKFNGLLGVMAQLNLYIKLISSAPEETRQRILDGYPGVASYVGFGDAFNSLEMAIANGYRVPFN